MAMYQYLSTQLDQLLSHQTHGINDTCGYGIEQLYQLVQHSLGAVPLDITPKEWKRQLTRLVTQVQDSDIKWTARMKLAVQRCGPWITRLLQEWPRSKTKDGASCQHLGEMIVTEIYHTLFSETGISLGPQSGGAETPNRSDQVCPICYETVQNHGVVCNHGNFRHPQLFHANCLEQWLTQSGRCPLCNLSINATTQHQILHPRNQLTVNGIRGYLQHLTQLNERFQQFWSSYGLMVMSSLAVIIAVSQFGTSNTLQLLKCLLMLLFIVLIVMAWIASLADDETDDGLDFDISDGPPNPTNIINEVCSFS